MKTFSAGAAIVVALGLIVVAGRASAKADDAGVIRISSIRVSARPTEAGRLQQFVLKNYALTSDNIGNAHVVCTTAGAERGPAPPGAYFCWGDYTIGHSSLQVQGLVRHELVFELAIIGGVGGYNGYGGTLKVVRYAENPIRERLVFRLTK